MQNDGLAAKACNHDLKGKTIHKTKKKVMLFQVGLHLQCVIETTNFIFLLSPLLVHNFLKIIYELDYCGFRITTTSIVPVSSDSLM